MKRILCYGDSNTWGHDPTTIDPKSGGFARYAEDVRWPGVMQAALGDGYFVCEEGLCGRTTVFEDPTHYGWNGYTHFEVAFKTCDPVDAIIFMLGTNDSKDMFNASADMITSGMQRLLRNCQNLMRDSMSADAKVIIACPLKPIMAGNGTYFYDFSEKSTEKIEKMHDTYKALAERSGCTFFDVNDFGVADPADGVHMDADSHRRVGLALADVVRGLLE